MGYSTPIVEYLLKPKSLSVEMRKLAILLLTANHHS